MTLDQEPIRFHGAKLPEGKFLPVGIEVFGSRQAFLIFPFEDFEFPIVKHSNDQTVLRVFSRAATNRAISTLKLAKLAVR